MRSLQAHWPETRITWIIGRTEAALLGDIPDIEFITFNKRDGFAGMRRLWREIADTRFDALLDMQVALRASIASLGIKAPIRLGFDRARARDFQWLFTNRQIAARPQEHVMDALFGFAEAIGVGERTLRWDIPIPDSARQRVAEWTRGEPYLLISPCSSDRARNFRNWRAERYAEIVTRVAAEFGLRTVVTGGPSALEKDYGQRIVELSGDAQPLNLVGQTNLKELFALIDGAQVVLAPDSGPVHMATAASTPVVGLYATSNPDRTGPYRDRTRVVNKYPEALALAGLGDVSDVRWGRRVRLPEAMDLIQVSDVWEKIADTLKSE